jgi:hypothetical protein
MRISWRVELVRAVDEVIKDVVRGHWPSMPDDYVKPRQEVEDLRSHILFLHPAPAPDRTDWNGTGHHGDPRFYVPRDLMLIDRCDILVSYIGTEGRNLGGAGEVGYAYARGRRIITVDTNPTHQSYDSWRVMSTSVFSNVVECARFLLFLVDDSLHVPYNVPALVVNPQTDILPEEYTVDRWETSEVPSR